MTALAANPFLTIQAAEETTPLVVGARGLGKTVDRRIVLHDVNLRIRAGEYIAILGTNGAGKTTLLKLLATLTTPTTGQLQLFGNDAMRTPSAIRRRIGLIDHQLLLYRDLSAIENLEFYAGLYGLDEPTKRAEEMLHRFNLLDRADDPVKSFSRGMSQRLAIGRALLHDPDLILADEPFAGLDAPSSEFLENAFQQIVTAGKTVVLVNHDIEQTLRLVDRVIVLRGGTIALDQPTHRLYLEEILAEVKA